MAKDLNAKISRDLDKRGIPHYPHPIYRASAKAFHKAIRKAKLSNPNSWMVDVHTREEYRGMKTYLSRDGMTGIAIKPNGDVVSVFSYAKKQDGSTRGASGNAMGSLIPFAIAHGGKKLDCYGKGLQHMYSRYGAKAVAQTPWNDEYKPSGWKEEDGRPPVVAMILPSYNEMLNKYKRRSFVDLTKVKSFFDYDEMINYRDAQMQRGASSASMALAVG